MAFFSRPQSSAVRIAKPTLEDDSSSAVKPAQQLPRKDSVQRQCRNIVIYGSCKYEDKGCIYYHPPAAADTQRPVPTTPASPILRSDSPATTHTLTPQAAKAPIFVPKSAAGVAASRNIASPPPLPTLSPSAETLTSLAPITPQPEYYTGEETLHNPQNGHQDYPYQQTYENFDYQVSQAEDESQALDTSETYYDPGTHNPYRDQHGYDQMDPGYYPSAPVFLRQPLNYLLYTPSLPPELIRNSTNSHFVPSSTDLRQILQERSEAIRGTAPTNLGLPEELQGYHTLVPIETTGPTAERRKFSNWHSTVYRAIKTSNGIPYALRRIENFRLMQQAAFAPIEFWSSIQHPGVVSVQEAFTTRAFGDNSLVVAYAYYPNAKTLYEAHIKPKPPTYKQTVYFGRQGQQQQQQQVLPERTLWSYIVQLASAIKKVHERGQAVRMIDASKILVTDQNRVRISSCGILDVLFYDISQESHYMERLQQEDLGALGRLIFALCCNNLGASNQQTLQKSMEFMTRTYSPDVKVFAGYLISKLPKTIDTVLEMIRDRVLVEHDEALMANDRLEYELLGELENARLVRLLCKFGFINERPEFAREPRWSETGDRYIIKLFRDYVFHQVDEHGNPVIDLSHVLTCLNKLDVGTDEQIMLVARDEQSCLVVSYKDIKTCIANAFDELTRATTAAQSKKERR